MSNLGLLASIDRALAPSDSFYPLKLLAVELKFKLPASLLEARAKVISTCDLAADRIEEVGEKLANVNATIADQISWVRAGLEAGELPDVNEPPSKAELRAVKLATAEIVASYAELVRGEAERFSDLAASRIGAIEASEQSECARFQIGYSRSALVAGLLKSLSHLERLFPAGEIAVNAYTDPKIFACWLQD